MKTVPIWKYRKALKMAADWKKEAGEQNAEVNKLRFVNIPEWQNLANSLSEKLEEANREKEVYFNMYKSMLTCLQDFNKINGNLVRKIGSMKGGAA